MKHRSQQDPDNLFVTSYMQKLLGIGDMKNTSVRS